MILYERERRRLLNGIPKKVLEVLKKSRAYLAGGALTSLFSEKPVHDYDLYFRSASGCNKALQFFDASDYFEGSFVSERARVYKSTQAKHARPFQLITFSRFTGEPQEILDMFDFTINQGVFDFESDTFYMRDRFLQHIAQRRLVFNPRTPYPLVSLLRVGKYQKRGYSISGIEIIRLGLAIQALQIDNLTNLRDQLLGIDVMYLLELMRTLKDKDDVQYNYNEFLEQLEACVAGELNLEGAGTDGQS